MRRPAFWLLVFVGWTVIAGVFAVSNSLTLMITYQPPQWDRTIPNALAEWYPWALLTPPVLWLGTRFRLRRGRRVTRLLVLIPAGLLAAFIKLTLTRVFQATSGTGDYIAITNVTTQYL